MRHIALQNKTRPLGCSRRRWDSPLASGRSPIQPDGRQRLYLFASIANYGLIVLHLQKHGRYSLVPLIPCAESAPGTYSSGTPAPWDERREQPCNLLRTPAIACNRRQIPISTVQIRFLCKAIGVSCDAINPLLKASLFVGCMSRSG